MVELFVVMAIGAILATLVLPSLSRVKRKAQQTVCLGNIRQINSAFRMYIDDANDVLPPSFTNQPSFTAAIALVRTYLDSGPRAGQVGTFTCPADTFYYDMPTTARAYRIAKPLHQQRGMDETSYGFNAGNFPYGPSQTPQWPGIAGWKSGAVRHPARTLLAFEFPALCPYSWHRPAGQAGRHNNAECVVGFIDGHASYVKMFWDVAHVRGSHLEAWQYDPPPPYAYQWSGH